MEKDKKRKMKENVKKIVNKFQTIPFTDRYLKIFDVNYKTILLTNLLVKELLKIILLYMLLTIK